LQVFLAIDLSDQQSIFGLEQTDIFYDVSQVRFFCCNF